MRPNVAFVIDELEVGGSQRQLLLMATGLVQRGWSVQVICLQPVLSMAEDFAAAGIPVHLLRKRRMIDPGLLFALGRFFLRHHIMIVHAFSSTAEFFAGLAARICGCRVIASVRNYNEQLPVRHRVAKRVSCRLAHAVVANSQAGAAAAIAARVVAGQKMHVIPNGVIVQPPILTKATTRRRLGIAEKALVSLSVGRLVWEKGYDATLELARRLRHSHPEALFLIVGDGPLRAALTERIDALGLNVQVQLLGERRDITHLLAAADFYLNTSASEGLSNSVMEAMAAGVAVVAAAAGGTTELIEDGTTGLLFTPGKLDGAEEKLNWVMENTALRAELGVQARRAMERQYSVENMITRIEHLYTRLLEARSVWVEQKASRHVG
ncbi:MAG: glycosyltransferase [Candidatus Binatia bacterium]